MKLILDKNFIKEKKDIWKDIVKGAVKYDWRLLNGEAIELYNMQDGEIAPIVNFLIKGKKSKISWLLIIGAGVLLFVFFFIMFLILKPAPEVEPIKTPVIVQPEVKPEVKPEIETQQISFEMINEFEVMENMKKEAELETLNLFYELQGEKLETKRLANEIEKLKNENTELNTELERLKLLNKNIEQRIIEKPEDEFIYYLGDITYERCKNPANVDLLRKCETLYFNYLQYEKKTRENWNF